MSNFSRWTTRTARQKLKKPCSFTRLPIEPGDRYVEYVDIYENKFYTIKFLSIAKSIYLHKIDEWEFEPDPYDFWVECLTNFLERIGLSPSDAKVCSEEARKFAVSENCVHPGKWTCFVCQKRATTGGECMHLQKSWKEEGDKSASNRTHH